ncbi:MAG TPA: glycosyltransferase family 2 protein [Bryobacteraceae bacterium]|nr:glycosyltransferase family 2 protein [Bryobacteraceae bacterium]
MSLQTSTGIEVRCVAGMESGINLYIPPDDVSDPEISIVIPALNEELNIAEFVRWCKEGLAEAGIRGEILIVDSSTDRTAQLALTGGARVLKAPKRGLGRAYIDAIPYIRGKYILMGDADCTYDFRQLKPFVEKFRDGYEYIMGSRFRGSIEPGAMPALHRYLGTPVTTWILNVLYATHFSDIHCGMRGITRDALVRINLSSQSWEYASEMVLKAVQMKLRITEVPVRFLKDRNGRVSHHKRMGWFSPWQAAWINLRAMFIYGADFFVLRPGLAMLWIGVLLMLAVMFGPITIGPVTFSLYWMLMGLTLAILGLQSFYLGCVAQVLNDLTGHARRRWTSLFRYTRSMGCSAGALAIGLAFATPLLRDYLRFGLSLPHEVPTASHMAIGGLFFIIASFMNFGFTLVIHAAAKD